MTMRVSEIRNLSDRDLEVKLEDLKEELFNLRFRSAVGQLENPMRIRTVRKAIARVMTIMRERELGINQ
jgi:large subunit ribosomal protein L29